MNDFNPQSEQNTKIINVAIGTDDKSTFSDEHFGSCKFFLIYKWNLTNNEIKLLKTIPNITPEESRHGDPIKAFNVSKTMKQEDVRVLVAKRMGQNIVRMRKHFIPVIVNYPTIKDCLPDLASISSEILQDLQKSDEIMKKVLHLPKK
ncbi:MAG: NifB/NifX family molybdenum-iron cluster-binding protein [Candidatus Lokiarchaeota archaeon]|nr:NifB/NifX family molybdenum-iron cluster-binding protein [Candidatus Harpocratesius repetitus]